jgi:[acyl-carrier-protein] S-malonyltransferase
MTNFYICFPLLFSTCWYVVELAQSYPVVLETFKQASDVIRYDLELVQQGPAKPLNQTDKTQPALLTASVNCGAFSGAAGSKPPLSLAIVWVNTPHYSAA